MKGRGGTIGPCSYAYSWYYDWYERRRLPPDRGDHRGRPAPSLDRRGEGLDRGREPGADDHGLGGGAALRAAPEPAVRLAAATRGPGSTRRSRVRAGGGRGGCGGDIAGAGGPDRDRARPGGGAGRAGRGGGGAGRGAGGGGGAAVIAGPPGVRIRLAAEPVDFRKGMGGLAALVQQALRADPFAGDVFIFRPRRGDRVKILVFDGTGLVISPPRNRCKGPAVGCVPSRRRRGPTRAGSMDGEPPWRGSSDRSER